MTPGFPVTQVIHMTNRFYLKMLSQGDKSLDFTVNRDQIRNLLLAIQVLYQPSYANLTLNLIHL